MAVDSPTKRDEKALRAHNLFGVTLISKPYPLLSAMALLGLRWREKNRVLFFIDDAFYSVKISYPSIR
ncbi:MAG: hypothetical protein N3D09_05140 [Archaeoglobaceae archaeon]|nr:hypothetical protein [Archaeoglobaceae archaeon]